MTAWTIGLGFLLALAVGYLIGHRVGVHSFVKMLDELDVDKYFLNQVKAKWSASGQGKLK